MASTHRRATVTWGVAEVNGQGFVDTPAERVRIAFAPRNDLGVLDHYLTLNSGEVIYVPMRVIADESGSEVVFTVRRRPGMTDDEFKQTAMPWPPILPGSSGYSRSEPS